MIATHLQGKVKYNFVLDQQLQMAASGILSIRTNIYSHHGRRKILFCLLCNIADTPKVSLWYCWCFHLDHHSSAKCHDSLKNGDLHTQQNTCQELQPYHHANGMRGRFELFGGLRHLNNDQEEQYLNTTRKRLDRKRMLNTIDAHYMRPGMWHQCRLGDTNPCSHE